MTKSKRFMVFVPVVSVFYRAVADGNGARTSKEATAKSTDSLERRPARSGPQVNRPRRNGFMRAAPLVASAASTAVALVAAAITPVHSQISNTRCETIQKNAAADRVEKIYNGFAVGTDAAEKEGYPAAQKAEEQLRLDFLSSFQNPQKNAANQTAWNQEEAQLISDSLKYGGDKTLDAAAMYWGETHLSLPVGSPQELLAQAKTMQVSDQPGEREYDKDMANYLAARFQSLNRLAPYYHSPSDDIEGRDVPLGLAALQAGLRIDEVDRTLQAASIVRSDC
jgi:hypothetical protein